MPDDELPNFNYILKAVRRFLPHSEYDHENIAAELVERGIRRGSIPNFTSIRNYCRDQARRRRVELRVLGELTAATRDTRSIPSPADKTDLVSKLVEDAQLHGNMREILILSIYLGRTDAEIAEHLKLKHYRVHELRNQALDRLRLAYKRLTERTDHHG